MSDTGFPPTLFHISLPRDDHNNNLPSISTVLDTVQGLFFKKINNIKSTQELREAGWRA